MTFNFNHETQKTKKRNLNEYIYKKKGEIENIGGKLGGGRGKTVYFPFIIFLSLYSFNLK